MSRNSKLRYQIGEGFGIFLIYQLIWTIFQPNIPFTHPGEIVRDIVSDDARKKMNLANDLLAILCCPETKQAVVLADDLLIQKVNGAIERGVLKKQGAEAGHGKARRRTDPIG